MNTNLTVKQATDFTISVTTTLDGSPIAGVSAAKYCVYGPKAVLVLEKTLGDGVSFANGVVKISFTETDTATLEGSFTHECLVRDLAGTDAFILEGSLRITKTLTRL